MDERGQGRGRGFLNSRKARLRFGRPIVAAGVLLGALSGCADAGPESLSPTRGSAASAEPAGATVPGLIGRKYDAAHRTQWRLPPALREVSGIAVLGERVFTHTDEQAVVFELDLATGDFSPFLKLTSGGGGLVLDDFEGIAFLQDDLFLITSRGLLFRAGGALGTGQGATDSFDVFDTGLADICEVEGLDTIGDTDLAIACKNVYGEGTQRIYAWHAERSELRLLLELPRVAKARPSAILVLADGYVLLSAKNALLQVFDDAGALVRSIELDGQAHKQAEGMGLLPDGRLVIADEGGKKGGRISVYAP